MRRIGGKRGRRTVTVDALSATSDAALAHDDDGAVVEVIGGVPGDRLDVTIVASGRARVHAELQSVASPSIDRVDAPCPVVATCSGCPWQSVGYDTQLDWKHRFVVEALRAYGLEPTCLTPVLPMDPPFRYRTKLQTPISGVAGALRSGLYRRRSHEVVTVDDCLVHDAHGEAARRGVLALLDSHQVTPHDELTGLGELRTLLLRVTGGAQVAVVLIVADAGRRDWPALGAALLAVPAVVSVSLNVNGERGNRVLGPTTVLLAGRPTLTERVGPVLMELEPTAFFQTSVRGAERLAQVVRSLLPAGVPLLLDLYAGAGFFAAALADRAERVLMVERDPAGAAACRALLQRLPCPAEVIEGDVAQLIAQQARLPAGAAVVLDPPRAGLADSVAEVLVALAPTRVVLLSCHLESGARDLARLVSEGLRLCSVTPVDLFPHTRHVELVSLLVPADVGTPPPAPSPREHGAKGAG